MLFFDKLLKRQIIGFNKHFQRMKKLKNNFDKTKSYCFAVLLITYDQLKKLDKKQLKIFLKNEVIYFELRGIFSNILNQITI
tara:strand:- start:3660 stop:3905 length:246 start_codon:yes stop_codon:yes gene_type:complete